MYTFISLSSSSISAIFSNLNWFLKISRILSFSFLSCCLRYLFCLDSASSLSFFCFDDSSCTSFDVNGFWFASFVPKTPLPDSWQISEAIFQASFGDIFDMLLCLSLSLNSEHKVFWFLVPLVL